MNNNIALQVSFANIEFTNNTISNQYSFTYYLFNYLNYDEVAAKTYNNNKFDLQLNASTIKFGVIYNFGKEKVAKIKLTEVEK